MYLKSLLTLSFIFVGAMMMQAQTVTSASATQETAKKAHCNPADCAAKIAAGLCSKEQVAACKAKNSSTKVASVKLERDEENAETVTESNVSAKKVSSCAKTCSKAKVANKSKT